MTTAEFLRPGIRPPAFRLFVAALVAAGVAACTAAGPDRGLGGPGVTAAARCSAFLTMVDHRVESAGVADGEAARIDGFPYLRANRFLASFAPDVMTDRQFTAWTERLRSLDRSARQAELANLPEEERTELSRLAGAATDHHLIAAVQFCTDQMMSEDQAAGRLRTGLANGVAVPDAYQDWKRWLGLYPLTALPVAIGYEQWQDENLAFFEPDGPTPPPRGAYVTYAPGPDRPFSAARAAEILARARARDPLGIGDFQPAETAELTEMFAPLWRVDTRTRDDRIGTVALAKSGHPEILTDQPAVYTRLSFTRRGDRILTQINYLAWFPARPRRGALDLLGGHLDGVIWRVTLGPDGRPILYDTIHACGCYHLFFPVPPLAAREPADPRDINEHAVAPQPGPRLQERQRIEIGLAAGSHYVTSVTAVTSKADAEAYLLYHEHGLRSLPTSNGERRSLYQPDGLVAGTERGERFLLWPMGIPSPGAMRQWGHHATAFVGRRHFDAPWLIDTWLRGPAPATP